MKNPAFFVRLSHLTFVGLDWPDSYEVRSPQPVFFVKTIIVKTIHAISCRCLTRYQLTTDIATYAISNDRWNGLAILQDTHQLNLHSRCDGGFLMENKADTVGKKNDRHRSICEGLRQINKSEINSLIDRVLTASSARQRVLH